MANEILIDAGDGTEKIREKLTSYLGDYHRDKNFIKFEVSCFVNMFNRVAYDGVIDCGEKDLMAILKSELTNYSSDSYKKYRLQKFITYAIWLSRN